MKENIKKKWEKWKQGKKKVMWMQDSADEWLEKKERACVSAVTVVCDEWTIRVMAVIRRRK